MIEVTRSIRIARAVHEVRAQFADVAHHQSTGHHRGVHFVVEDDDGITCRYRQTTRLGPIRTEQRFVLERGDLSRQVNDLVAGFLSPGQICFEITPHGSGTHVAATFRCAGRSRLFDAVIAGTVGRALDQALHEDRIDLESGNYADRQGNTPTWTTFPSSRLASEVGGWVSRHR